MALNDSNYFTNAIQGDPQVGADFNIFDTHSTPRYAVGTRIKRANGDNFVYSHFGLDTAAGVVVAPDISESGEAAVVDNAIIAPASAVAFNNEQPGAIGSKSVQMTNASITADMFAGGKLIISAGTGVGFTYRIKGNTATGNPATGDIRIDLYERLQLALSTSSDVIVAPSGYSNLEVATIATDTLAAGVSCSTQTTADLAWGWIQTKGVVGIIADGTITVGDMVSLSDGVAGTVAILGQGTTAVATLETARMIGNCIVAAGASTEHGCFYVDIS